MSYRYTTDGYGEIAVPVSGWVGTQTLPKILGAGRVREMAREVADSIIETARTIHGPVVWITGNSYMPPMRSIPAAETVYQADNNRDGELFAWFVEMVEEHVSAAEVALEAPDYDNSLYAVDMRRWQYREDADDTDDLNDEWEPKDS